MTSRECEVKQGNKSDFAECDVRGNDSHRLTQAHKESQNATFVEANHAQSTHGGRETRPLIRGVMGWIGPHIREDGQHHRGDGITRLSGHRRSGQSGRSSRGRADHWSRSTSASAVWREVAPAGSVGTPARCWSGQQGHYRGIRGRRRVPRVPFNLSCRRARLSAFGNRQGWRKSRTTPATRRFSRGEPSFVATVAWMFRAVEMLCMSLRLPRGSAALPPQVGLGAVSHRLTRAWITMLPSAVPIDPDIRRQDWLLPLPILDCRLCAFGPSVHRFLCQMFYVDDLLREMGGLFGDVFGEYWLEASQMCVLRAISSFGIASRHVATQCRHLLQRLMESTLTMPLRATDDRLANKAYVVDEHS